MVLLRCFVALLDLEALDLVAALRVFMGTILVPGEAQKISRIIRPSSDSPRVLSLFL